VWPVVIALRLVSFGECAGFWHGREPLAIQQLIWKPAVEHLAVGVLGIADDLTELHLISQVTPEDMRPLSVIPDGWRKPHSHTAVGAVACASPPMLPRAWSVSMVLLTKARRS